MYQAIRIAVRNIFRQKKRSILLGGAVAFGFLVITLINGFTAGMVATTKDNFSHTFGGHIYITGTEISSLGTELSMITDDSTARSAIAILGDRVASVHQRSRTNGTLYFGTIERSVKLEGIDFADEKDFRSSIEISRGNLDDLEKPESLVLPDDTAKKLGAEIGETIIYKTQTVTGQQNLTEFTLIATTVSGGIMALDTGYAEKAALNAVIGLDVSSFQKINVYLKDVGDIKAATDTLYAELSRLGPQKNAQRRVWAGLCR